MWQRYEYFMLILKGVLRLARWRTALPAIAVVSCLMMVATALSAETVTFTVDRTRHVSRLSNLQSHFEWYLPENDPRSTYVFVVETPDEVFEVSWSFVYWTFDNPERWRAFQPSGTYRAVVTGWQIPWLGQYRNIVEIVDEVTVSG